MQPWLVLIVSFPTHPSSLRVKAWRRLRAVGAVALKKSVYLLPLSPAHHEHFQWLAQEIQKGGGEATLLKVDQVENMAPADVVRLFQEARDQDYRALAERFREIQRRLGRKTPGGARASRDEPLVRLTRELDRVREIDFFDAPGYQEARRLRDAIAMRLHRSAAPPDRPALSLDAGRGRRWATRPRPHVDRIASAWLIKRFVDPDAEFVFAPAEALPPDAIPFDVLGADLSHHGDDTTFETLVKRARLRDRRLAELAEIVHDVDLRDDKYRRPEARGVDVVIRGLLLALKDDHEVLAHGLVLFDGLYAGMSRG